MKIRNGFVSNSSSSSFVILYKSFNNNPCPHCGRSDLGLYEVIDNYGDYDFEIYSTNTENIIENLKCNHRQEIDKTGAYYNENVDKKISQVFKEINENKQTKQFDKIIECSLSYHSDITLNIIKNMEKVGTAKIIYSTEN